MLPEFGSDGIGDGRQRIEIEVPSMLRELSGHGEREADDLMQVEMRGIVADDTFGCVAG